MYPDALWVWIRWHAREYTAVPGINSPNQKRAGGDAGARRILPEDDSEILKKIQYCLTGNSVIYFYYDRNNSYGALACRRRQHYIRYIIWSEYKFCNIGFRMELFTYIPMSYFCGANGRSIGLIRGIVNWVINCSKVNMVVRIMVLNQIYHWGIFIYYKQIHTVYSSVTKAYECMYEICTQVALYVKVR